LQTRHFMYELKPSLICSEGILTYEVVPDADVCPNQDTIETVTKLYARSQLIVGATSELTAIRSVDHELKAKERCAPARC